jgi:hypothetical protein
MYFPKSQITPNLYTNGDEFILKPNNLLYTGYYYKLSIGKYFTGKTPQDKPNVELIPLFVTNTNITSIINPNQLITITDESPEYNSLKKDRDNLLVPYYSPILPAANDYQVGEFRRCFCKKINEVTYIEINKETYNQLIKNDQAIAYEYYQPFNVPWRLTGKEEDVYKINRNIVALTIKNQRLPMFDQYIQKDYTKYYK